MNLNQTSTFIKSNKTDKHKFNDNFLKTIFNIFQFYKENAFYEVVKKIGMDFFQIEP